MKGFLFVEENPLGPVQLYVLPAIESDVNERVFPSQRGELFEIIGVAGTRLTVTWVDTAPDAGQPAAITITEYTPVSEIAAPVIDGFWRDDVNPLGPDQE